MWSFLLAANPAVLCFDFSSDQSAATYTTPLHPTCAEGSQIIAALSQMKDPTLKMQNIDFWGWNTDNWIVDSRSRIYCHIYSASTLMSLKLRHPLKMYCVHMLGRKTLSGSIKAIFIAISETFAFVFNIFYFSFRMMIKLNEKYL